MGVFDIVMKKPAEVSRSDEYVRYSDAKNLLKSVEEYVLDIVMEKPAVVS